MKALSLLPLLLLCSLILPSRSLSAQNESLVLNQQMFHEIQTFADETNGGMLVVGETYSRNIISPKSSIHAINQDGSLRWQSEIDFGFDDYQIVNVSSAGPDHWLIHRPSFVCVDAPENFIDEPILIERLTGNMMLVNDDQSELGNTPFRLVADDDLTSLFMADESGLMRRDLAGGEFEPYVDYPDLSYEPFDQPHATTHVRKLPGDLALFAVNEEIRLINLATAELIAAELMPAVVSDVLVKDSVAYLIAGNSLYSLSMAGEITGFPQNFANLSFATTDQPGLAFYSAAGTYARLDVTDATPLAFGILMLGDSLHAGVHYRDGQMLAVAQRGGEGSTEEFFATSVSEPLDDEMEFTLVPQSDVSLTVESANIDSLVYITYPDGSSGPATTYFSFELTNTGDETIENFVLIFDHQKIVAGCDINFGNNFFDRYHYIDDLSIPPGATITSPYSLFNFGPSQGNEIEFSLEFRFPNQRPDVLSGANRVDVIVSNTQNFLPASAWTISPNPISPDQDLRLDTEISEPLDWSIFSPGGQLLRRGTTKGSMAAIRHGLTSPGLYLLRIQTDSGVGTKRFVLH